MKGDKHMEETKDFRTFKQKIHEAKTKVENTVAIGWHNTVVFCKENKEFCFGLAMVAIPGMLKVGNSLIRHHQIALEDKRRNCDIWDPKRGQHYIIRKPLKPYQQIEYNRRYDNGEDGAYILRSFGVL